MSRNIGQKKRFEVLQRDGFSCKYCGQKAPFVQLEVDHIVPRSNGGTNEINNLITACFNCNRGKGSTEIVGDSKNLYKTKINDAIYKCKMEFYDMWNKNMMGSISEKTKVLLSMWIKEIFDWDEIVSVRSYLDKLDYEEQKSLFLLGGDVCDSALKHVIGSMKVDFDLYIDSILDKKNWTGSDEYDRKLNYLLTDELKNMFKPHVLYKYTLFPKLLSDG